MSAQESTASIDDLLRHEEPQRPQPRRGRVSAGWLLRTALVAAALTAAAVVGLRMVGLGASTVGLYGGILALLLIRRVAAPLKPPPDRRTTWRRIARGQVLDWDGQDALRIAVRDWQERLTWADATRGSFERLVVQPLRELTDERLRQRHGITLASEPDRARTLLGEQLWTFLEGGSDRPATPREYAAIVSQLERF